MKGQDIVNQFKKVFPLYSKDFSDEINISSLTKTGTTVSVTTSLPHGRSTGDFVVIDGAKEPITISSITRDNNIVTVTCLTKHKLPVFNKLLKNQIPTIEISGVNPIEYNGIYQLYQTIDYFTFQYKINTTPTTPASVNGFYLRLDNGDYAYNGSKSIIVTGNNTFDYEINQDLQSPAQGDIKLYSNMRIRNAAGLDLAESHYSPDSNGLLQNWMYVVVSDEEIFRKGTTSTDIDSTQDVNEEFRYDSLTPFNVFIFLSAKANSLAGVQADQARSYRKAMLKTIANFILPSELTECFLKPVSYQGNGAELLTEAYYVHRYTFASKGEIVNNDTVDPASLVPLREMDSITNEEVELKIDFGD